MKLKKFQSKKVLEEQLCSDMIRCIDSAIAEFGRAHILLSGGSTPLNLYKLLGSKKYDASKVMIGLVDERFVPYESEYSNQRKIDEALNKNYLQSIRVMPLSLYEDENSFPDFDYQSLIEDLYAPFFERIDFCLLGMGDDGHTASLFPNDDASTKLLEQNESAIDITFAPNFPEKRISCNKHMLLQSRNLALMIVGEEKLEVLHSSEEHNLPISHFLKEENELIIYYSEI